MAEPTVLLLSTSDTDLISARSSGKNYRWANPSRLSDDELPELLSGVSIVVVRILGGYRAWQSGVDVVIASGVPAVLVSGEQAADAELTDLSTVAAGTVVQAHIYLAHGGVDNLRQLYAFLSDTVLMTGYGFAPPLVTPTWGELARTDAAKIDCPTIAVLYYRAQHLAGNTAYVEALCRAIEDAGGRALPMYCASLRTAEPELLDRLADADAMVVTVLAAGGVKPPPPQPVATTTAGASNTLPHWISRSCRGSA
ncbi:cobN/Magnesium Chelatase family protein [Mycobacterium kansasii]|uniref:CobN/Magnesium Chelatase family protein n=1 Tax=Mycobacterium kansasii TaxID=1768 RepID=A0A1V3X3B2_MYCKA|nr:cobN/Magnesium Chelatase family protein [Mycobacterium kansasii]